MTRPFTDLLWYSDPLPIYVAGKLIGGDDTTKCWEAESVIRSAIRGGKLPASDKVADTYSTTIAMADFKAWLPTIGIDLTASKQDESAATTANVTVTNNPVKGMTKQPVINAFEGLYFNRDSWDTALANTPKWLEDCRVAKGSRRASATWNPVLIGLALIDKNVSLKKLDIVFVGLEDWQDEWQEKTDLMR